MPPTAEASWASMAALPRCVKSPRASPLMPSPAAAALRSLVMVEYTPPLWFAPRDENAPDERSAAMARPPASQGAAAPRVAAKLLAPAAPASAAAKVPASSATPVPASIARLAAMADCGSLSASSNSSPHAVCRRQRADGVAAHQPDRIGIAQRRGRCACHVAKLYQCGRVDGR